MSTLTIPGRNDEEFDLLSGLGWSKVFVE